MARPDGTQERGSVQDYVDLVLAAQEHGFLRTSMPTLDEEQIVGSLTSQVKQNGPIFALMLARLQVFSQARFQWTRFNRGEPGDLFGSQELSILERPWPGGTTADLLARMEMDVTGFGNSYTRRVMRQMGRGDRLVRMRPDWVALVLGSQEDAEHPSEAADVELLGYVYMPHHDRGERMVVLEPDEVAHYAPIPDPDGVFTGMSWITPVFRDVIGDQLQNEHKRAFLKNAATPNLAIRFDPKITKDQVKEFKAIMEAEHKGAWNAFKTLYIGGGADVTPLGNSFKEIEFSVTMGKAESRMAAAAGVPPSWVGFSEGLQGSALNAGNFTAARRRFGDGTLAHLWNNAATSLETLVRTPDPNAHLWYATRGIPFLNMDAKDQAEVQAQDAQTIATLIREGCTLESITEALQTRDWSRLVQRTDENGAPLISVQLQPAAALSIEPGQSNGNGDPGRARAALTAGGN
jgi:hypothetical protein